MEMPPEAPPPRPAEAEQSALQFFVGLLLLIGLPPLSLVAAANVAKLFGIGAGLLALLAFGAAWVAMMPRNPSGCLDQNLILWGGMWYIGGLLLFASLCVRFLFA
jgi:hypothetical protein